MEALHSHTNAIVSLNPNALITADEDDLKPQANNGRYGPLLCIPILLKDNYDTAEVPTIGGDLDIAKSRPSEGAPVVKVLKDASAIVLGKANLHLAAMTGTPVVTVPVDFSSATETAPRGNLLGIEILGSEWMKGEVWKVAYVVQRLGRVRRMRERT